MINRNELKLNSPCLSGILLASALLMLNVPAVEAFQKPSKENSTENQEQSEEASAAEPKVSSDSETPEESEELSEADRIASLQSTIDEDEQRLITALNELKTINDEFETASKEFTQLKEEVEEKSIELQELRDAGKNEEAGRLESDIQELKARQTLARERFELSIRAQRTAQLQISTLQEKVKKSKAALDRLKGIDPGQSISNEATGTAASADGGSSLTPKSASGADSEPTAGSGENTAADAESDSAADQQASENSADDEEPISEKAAAAQLQSQEKSLAAEEAEAEIKDLSDRKQTLEQDITLEQQALENAQDRYDNLDESLISLEAKLRDKVSSNASQKELSLLRERIESTRGSLRGVRTKIREHTERLQTLRSQLLSLQSEELLLAEEAEAKRREAEEARRYEWLVTMTETFKVKAPKIGLVLLMMLVLRWLANLLSRRIVKLLARASRGTAEERENRANTLVGVFRSTALIAIVVGGTLMILDIAGVPIGPLLGGAAVFGLAIAFGAQNLIRDYFYGFMILLENQYRLKDVATVAGTTGVVEQITLRLTVLRDLNGHVHFIPNGTITSVTNHTHGWSQAVFDVGVAYKEDVDYVMQVLLELGREMQNDPVFGNDILQEPEMCGVNEFGDSAVVIRLLLKTKYNRMWPVKREMNRRIKNRFDELGIEIPFPHRTLVFQNGNQAETMNVASATT